jgi:hypothetical protein
VALAGSVILVSAPACSSTSSSLSPGSPSDQAYLGEVHSAVPGIGTLRSDTQLVRLGHAACDGFAAGASFQELADRLVVEEGSKSLPSEDLGAVITAAADNFCPQYRGRVS